jgi:hypothetical protein
MIFSKREGQWPKKILRQVPMQLVLNPERKTTNSSNSQLRRTYHKWRRNFGVLFFPDDDPIDFLEAFESQHPKDTRDFISKNRHDQMNYRQLRTQRLLQHSMQLPMKTLEVIQSKE